MINPQLPPSGAKQIINILDSFVKGSLKKDLRDHNGKRLFCLAKDFSGRGLRPWQVPSLLRKYYLWKGRAEDAKMKSCLESCVGIAVSLHRGVVTDLQSSSKLFMGVLRKMR